MAQLKQPPSDESGPADRSRIRLLLEVLAAEHNRGQLTHRHPALTELHNLVGTNGLYAFCYLPRDELVTGADLERIEERLLPK